MIASFHRRWSGFHGGLPWILVVFALSGCGDGADPGGDRAATEVAAGGDGDVEGALERIANLGYVGSAPEAETAETIVQYDAEAAQPGLNLVVSAHANDVTLMDMDGREVHRWARRFEDCFPAYSGRSTEFQRRGWRRARLLPEGDLLAIQEGIGLVRLDRESGLRWALENQAHHDLDVDSEGRIYVLTRHVVASTYSADGEPALIDAVDLVSEEGERLDRISVEEAYQASDFKVELPGDHPGGDIFHANTIVVLDGQLAGHDADFRAGNLLLSFRNIHELAVMDAEARKIVWVLKGEWRRQHEPSILPNGHILMFDNAGLRGQRDNARVIEIDPWSGEILRSSVGGPGYQFKTTTAGTVYRLANGNLLVTDTNWARAFEVTAGGRLVWHYESPYPSVVRKGRRAFLYDVVRIDPADVRGWLGASGQ